MTIGPEVAPPVEVTIIAEPVRERLEQVLDRHRETWTAIDPALSDPLESIRRLVLAGGKRLRPAFCYWGFRAADGDGRDPIVVDVGAAFELLHAFALIHDDVMDGSPLRRGAPTVHVDFSNTHTAGSWRGEHRRFGDGVAILVGDLASVMADDLLVALPPDAVGVWNRLRLEVNIGQYLDVLGAAQGTFDLDRARLVARYKSGKYTVERPLHMGAALAGGLHRLEDRLSAYGEPLGEAFQLRDDLLGVFGDPAVTGKPVGDDLREGKPTPLLVLAQERAEPADQPLLARVGDPELGPDDVTELCDLFERCGARATIEDSIEALTSQAVGHLEDAAFAPEVAVALERLAHYVGRRDH